jgi:thymidylate synthase (FAD)
MNERKVHEHGFVRLVDSMPRENLDDSIVQAARVSYGEGTALSRSTEGLIRYLLRHWHTTPFEMVEFKFHLKMPIFVARQHLRHRMASVNEMSARYSVVPDEFFTPQGYRRQTTVNKQSSDGRIENSDELGRTIKTKTTEMFQMYTDALGQGCCRELARCHLPQSTYTEFYWKINLHNLMHYLQLRMEPGAQEEIRDYAYAIYSLVQPLAPVTMRAFQDFRLGSMTLTRQEIILLRPTVTEEDVQRSELSPGEKREFLNKLKTLRFL